MPDHAELFIGGTWQPPAGGSLGGTPPAAKLGRPDDPPGKRLRSITSFAWSNSGCQTISGRPSRKQSRSFSKVFRAM